MKMVNMLEAKASLSRLIDALQHGREDEIIIAQRGRPVARLVPLDTASTGKRLGVAKGLFDVPDDIDSPNQAVAQLLSGEGTPEPSI